MAQVLDENKSLEKQREKLTERIKHLKRQQHQEEDFNTGANQMDESIFVSRRLSDQNSRCIIPCNYKHQRNE